jgi:hypothetical protein
VAKDRLVYSSLICLYYRHQRNRISIT